LPGYTGFVNLLDYTASVIPVMLVDKNIDVVDKDFKPLNEKDADVNAICKIGPELRCVYVY
jgi:amidase